MMEILKLMFDHYFFKTILLVLSKLKNLYYMIYIRISLINFEPLKSSNHEIIEIKNCNHEKNHQKRVTMLTLMIISLIKNI